MTWQSPYNWMEVEQMPEVTVVRFTCRAILGESTIRTIGDELFRLVEKGGRSQLVLDFGEVKNLGSYMLATLIQLHRKVSAANGRLVLCSVDPEIHKLFEMTQLIKTFQIYPDEMEALQSFEKK
jgi:anti-anti-sigma factor